MSSTRRDFIKTTSAAGLAAALPPIPVIDPRPRPALRRRRPDDELRVAVIGLRGRGWNHVQAFESLDHVSVVALCDCDRDVLDKRAGEFERTHGRSIDAAIDYRTLLDRPDIDIVSIATPNHWHAMMTMDACLAGKDVYVEKPVTHNIGEGVLLLNVVARTGRIVQSGMQSRSTPAIHEGIAWMHEGHMGDMTLARGLCYKPRRSIGRVLRAQPVPASIDYDLWTGPAPMKPLLRSKLHYDWHWNFDTGNGDLGNQGVHQVDICRWAIGARSMPRSVSSIGGRLGYLDDGTTPNTQVVLLDYPKVPMLFEVRGLPRDRDAQEGDWNGSMDTYLDQRIASIIHCEGGALVVPTGSRDCWAVDLEGRRIMSWSEHADHFANFIEAVRSRETNGLNAGILEGVRSSELCHLGNISHRLGSTASLETALETADTHPEYYESVQRMSRHLAANGIDSEAEAIIIGPTLEIDQVNDRFTNSDSANMMRERNGRPPFTYPKLT
ncbi:MAG: Gfo/Idh/MocA family oxidoreductase [Phycisphaerales bacterium]|nr:Gfo/Idh/MocA family oxidoreductase [Phycisphaerales bacterium]